MTFQLAKQTTFDGCDGSCWPVDGRLWLPAALEITPPPRFSLRNDLSEDLNIRLLLNHFFLLKQSRSDNNA